MGRIMAQTPSVRDIRGVPLTIGLLVGGIILLGTAIKSVNGASDWHNTHIDGRIANYANALIYPRIKALEDSIVRIERDQAKIFEMIERQDYTRNRQYGEVKSMLISNQEDTKKIINHLLVNK